MITDFKPMLCRASTIKDVEQGLFSPLEWVAERKVDGVRAYVVDGKIFDRRGKEITHKFPELKELADVTEDGMYLLDGEIVATTWEFNDTAGRMHMKDKLYIEVASKSSPCMFVMFDMIAQNSTDTPNGKQIMRRGRMDIRIALMEIEGCQLVEQGEPQDLLAKSKQEGWEGVVLKRKDSKYQYKRSSDWVKVKLFIEVVHTFTKFEENSHGVTIEDDDGRRVVVNGKKAVDVKAEFAKHGTVTAEIQFLPQSNSTAWRFPSFRGVVKEAK